MLGNEIAEHKPVLWRAVTLDEKRALELFCKKRMTRVVDECKSQLEEVFELRNPRYRFNEPEAGALQAFFAEVGASQDMVAFGNWVFYPWLNTMVHVLPEEMFYELRTGRNRDLISQEEQDSFYRKTVASIAGLSVGSHIALTLVMMGGCKRIRLADPDCVSGSNLNRIRTGVGSIGLNKAVLSARLIYEMNPYAEVEIFDAGVTKENVDAFLLDEDGRRQIVVEEMDDPRMKIFLRMECKKRKLPVVMATDNSDGILVDIERYDLNPENAIFNGRLSDVGGDHFDEDPEKLPEIAAAIAGPQDASPEMLESVLKVGRSLYSWPQLGSAASLCGSAVAFVLRSICLGKEVKRGRVVIDLDQMFLADYSEKRVNAKRGALLEKLSSDGR